MLRCNRLPSCSILGEFLSSDSAALRVSKKASESIGWHSGLLPGLRVGHPAVYGSVDRPARSSLYDTEGHEAQQTRTQDTRGMLNDDDWYWPVAR